MYKFIGLLVCITYVCGDIAPGQNQYLPPAKGYNYDKPQRPFPSINTPTQVPYPQPQPQPRPQPRPQPQPQPQQPNTYIPPPVVQPTQRPYTPQPQPQPNTGYPQRPSTPVDHSHHEDHHHHEPGMPFDFNYAVNDVETQNDYSHKAVSDGDVTRGEYRIQLPDGRTQIVRYTADWKNGYNAEVSYEGTAQYPEDVNKGGYKY